MAYAVTDDVITACGGIAIDATSDPSATDATNWIAETDAELDALLADAGFEVPVTGASPLNIVKGKVAAHVGARVTRAHAVSRNDPELAKLATEMDGTWREFIAMISAKPGVVGQLIGQSVATVGSGGNARSHITHRTTDATADDLEPKLTTDMEN